MNPRRHRRRLIVAGGLATVVAITACALFYFEPQKLFIDDEVNESFPVVTQPAPATPMSADSGPTLAPASPNATGALAPPSSMLPVGPMAERAGRFVSREHDTSGTATIYRLDDGGHIVRIEDLHTSNGPALFVYLSANTATGPESAFDDAYVDLGGLKGNIGDQNYEIPAGADVASYTSVVIWCDRFDAAFGAADLA